MTSISARVARVVPVIGKRPHKLKRLKFTSKKLSVLDAPPSSPKSHYLAPTPDTPSPCPFNQYGLTRTLSFSVKSSKSINEDDGGELLTRGLRAVSLDKERPAAPLDMRLLHERLEALQQARIMEFC